MKTFVTLTDPLLKWVQSHPSRLILSNGQMRDSGSSLLGKCKLNFLLF